jgi:integrase
LSIDSERLLDHFHRAVYLAFVRLEARICQTQLTDAEADDVAFYLQRGKVRSVGGSRLTQETQAARTIYRERITAIADLLAIPVSRRTKHMDTYAFRHSHATWASDQGVAEVCIAKQLGHKVRGITGRYLSLESRKLIDSKRCSHAVWEMLLNAQASTSEQNVPALTGSS